MDEYVDAYPSGVNVVNYATLAGKPADATKLAEYVAYLQGIDPRGSLPLGADGILDQPHLYNAVTVNVVLGAYPVESIEQVHEGVVPLTGLWNDVHANLAGKDLPLDQIEHGILCPIWRDKRIHYAVNCAAYGCPHLIETAFTAANTESVLEAGAQAFVNSLRGVHVVDDDFVIISSIYDWYANDFGGTEESGIEHLIHYADGELADFLQAFEGVIEYGYDWDLNQPLQGGARARHVGGRRRPYEFCTTLEGEKGMKRFVVVGVLVAVDAGLFQVSLLASGSVGPGGDNVGPRAAYSQGKVLTFDLLVCDSCPLSRGDEPPSSKSLIGQ